MTATYYLDAALGKLPRAPDGTPDARDLWVIRRYMENAKVRLELLEKRNDPPAPPEWRMT